MQSSLSVSHILDVAQNVTNEIKDYEFLKFFDSDYKSTDDMRYLAHNAQRVIYLINNMPSNNDKYVSYRFIKKYIGEFLNRIEIITSANKKLRARVKNYKEQLEIYKRHEKYEKLKERKLKNG